LKCKKGDTNYQQHFHNQKDINTDVVFSENLANFFLPMQKNHFQALGNPGHTQRNIDFLF
tara:strand:+ start:279 stop:458 length:180 start_codon:yes stop_codon:yes gene_type:complete